MDEHVIEVSAMREYWGDGKHTEFVWLDPHGSSMLLIKPEGRAARLLEPVKVEYDLNCLEVSPWLYKESLRREADTYLADLGARRMMVSWILNSHRSIWLVPIPA